MEILSTSTSKLNTLDPHPYPAEPPQGFMCFSELVINHTHTFLVLSVEVIIGRHMEMFSYLQGAMPSIFKWMHLCSCVI